jgi:DNA-binding response OmpR family regulator
MTLILIVEDNANLAFGLSKSLEGEGYEVIVAEDGRQGLEMARTERPDLIVLDIMLPHVDGHEMLRTLRDEGNHTPVLILTARSEEVDRVLGLRLGADDYVTKPFSLAELTERVRAILRRAETWVRSDSRQPRRQRFGDVEVDVPTRTVVREGRPVLLTPKEFDLLQALLRRDGAIAARVELLHEVWGHRTEVMTRTVDIHIAELRRKLEPEPARPKHILTVWKVGYRLVA